MNFRRLSLLIVALIPLWTIGIASATPTSSAPNELMLVSRTPLPDNLGFDIGIIDPATNIRYLAGQTKLMMFELGEAGDLHAQLIDPRGALRSGEWGRIVASSYTSMPVETLTYVNLTAPTELHLRVFSASGSPLTGVHTVDIERTWLDDPYSLAPGGNRGPCDLTGPALAPGTYENLILRHDDWYRFDISGLERVDVSIEYEFFSGNLQLMVLRDDGPCADIFQRVLAGSHSMLPQNREDIAGLEVGGQNTILVRVYGAIRDTNAYTLRVAPSPWCNVASFAGAAASSRGPRFEGGFACIMPQPIESAMNIGPICGAELRAVGIATVDDLRQHGWETVYERWVERFPDRSHSMVAYALIGAEQGVNITQLSATDKERARRLTRRLKANLR